MAFWLRAGLVIGVIYYLSPLRPGGTPELAEMPATVSARTAPATLGEIAGPALAMLPEALRGRMAEAAAAEAGHVLGAGMRAAAAEAVRSPSRDTLTSHDRQPTWRGAPEREAR